MFDFGFDKLALIAVVALVVIGPERLPRVARTVGHLLGKAQRYVSDVKAEVHRTMELEELKKMHSQVESSLRDAHQSVTSQALQTGSEIEAAWSQSTSSDSDSSFHSATPWVQPLPRKNWRIKRSGIPAWYKQRHGLRQRVQSGAARVARLRPARGQQS